MATTTLFRTIRNEQGEIESLNEFINNEEVVERVPGKMGRFDFFLKAYNKYVDEGNWNTPVSRGTVLNTLKEKGYRTFQFREYCSLFIKGLAVKGDPNVQEIPQEKSVSTFLDECTDESDVFVYGSTKLYAYYCLFSAEKEVEPLTFNNFRKEMLKSNKFEIRKVSKNMDKTFEAVIGVRPDYMTVFILAKKAKIDEEKLKEMEVKKNRIDEKFRELKKDGVFENVFKFENIKEETPSVENNHHPKKYEKSSWKLNTSKKFNDLANLVFAGKISSDNYFDGIESAMSVNVPLDFMKYKSLLDIKYTLKTKFQAIKEEDRNIWLKSASMFFNQTSSNILKAKSKEEIEELNEVFKKNIESL